MPVATQVLEEFRSLFQGKRYLHRDSSLGDRVAVKLFDEFLLLPFRATNVAPFPFEWVDYPKTDREYSALLLRVSREYDQRFP